MFRKVTEKYILHHTKQLNVETINVLDLSGDDNLYYIDFACKFKNLDNILDEKNENANSDELMKQSVSNSLQKNDEFFNDIIKPLNANNDEKRIKIDKFMIMIRGINDISIDQEIEERQHIASSGKKNLISSILNH